MNFRYRYFLVIPFLVITACVFRHIDESQELGSNFYFLVDGKMSTIYYNIANEGEERKGVELVSPRVINYNYNDKYIIAKSMDINESTVKYWILDKSQKDETVYPMDSLQFSKSLLEKGIDLFFDQKDNVTSQSN